MPLVDQIEQNLGRKPKEASADAGYASEANLKALAEREIAGYVATEHAKHPADVKRKITGPLTGMRDKLKRAGWRSRYRLRKQIVEPVFGQTTATRFIRVRCGRACPRKRLRISRTSMVLSSLRFRRKLARWAADNAVALGDAKPGQPPGFHNRLAANFHLLFAIADQAGGAWPKRARQAAVKLSQQNAEPSQGRRLLAALREIFANRNEVPSARDRRAARCRSDRRMVRVFAVAPRLHIVSSPCS